MEFVSFLSQIDNGHSVSFLSIFDEFQTKCKTFCMRVRVRD